MVVAGIPEPQAGLQPCKGPADPQTVLCPQLQNAPSWGRRHELEGIKDQRGDGRERLMTSGSGRSQMVSLATLNFPLCFWISECYCPCFKGYPAMVPSFPIAFHPQDVILRQSTLTRGAVIGAQKVLLWRKMLSSFATIWGWGTFSHNGHSFLCKTPALLECNIHGLDKHPCSSARTALSDFRVYV